MTRRQWQMIAGTAALALTGAATADTLPFSGNMGESTSGLADFDGTVTYTPTTGDLGQLIISLTNTTDAALGGFLTAFVFNINSADGDASATFVSGPNANWGGITDANAAPFGTFDAGASTSNQFQGGGNPNRGLAVGATGTFEFTITADDAASLTAADFFEDGPLEFNFVARFRGLTNGGSDKVPVGGGDNPVIPLPAGGLMAAAGLAALALRRRR